MSNKWQSPQRHQEIGSNDRTGKEERASTALKSQQLLPKWGNLQCKPCRAYSVRDGNNSSTANRREISAPTRVVPSAGEGGDRMNNQCAPTMYTRTVINGLIGKGDEAAASDKAVHLPQVRSHHQDRELPLLVCRQSVPSTSVRKFVAPSMFPHLPDDNNRDVNVKQSYENEGGVGFASSMRQRNCFNNADVLPQSASKNSQVRHEVRMPHNPGLNELRVSQTHPHTSNGATEFTKGPFSANKNSHGGANNEDLASSNYISGQDNEEMCCTNKGNRLQRAALMPFNRVDERRNDGKLGISSSKGRILSTDAVSRDVTYTPSAQALSSYNEANGETPFMPPNVIHISTTTATKTVRKVKYLPLDEEYIDSDGEEEPPIEAIPPEVLSTDNNNRHNVPSHLPSFPSSRKGISEDGRLRLTSGKENEKFSRNLSKSNSLRTINGISPMSILGSYKWVCRRPVTRESFPFPEAYPAPAPMLILPGESSGTGEPRFLLQRHQQRLVIGAQVDDLKCHQGKWSGFKGGNSSPSTVREIEEEEEEVRGKEEVAPTKRNTSVAGGHARPFRRLSFSDSLNDGRKSSERSTSMHSSGACSTMTQAITMDGETDSALDVVVVKKSKNSGDKGVVTGMNEWEEENGEDVPYNLFPTSPTLTIPALKASSRKPNFQLGQQEHRSLSASNDSRRWPA
ncbi:hypothetical protein MOQ_005898 [Trypanosoma cruzi marinkellei]|uniref:Uncharacterized protein n=1 Tax=Trypanosoma cruzi marinkellei TaxID=85056 RepID=K2MX00_TRYCR|nr:hypothetical protein MOQ_005898 [Trypanosoma cruzi marinkellei]